MVESKGTEQMTEKSYKWVHIGGGTDLVNKGTHPCDDQYEHEDTMKTFVVICTPEAHSKMPKRVRQPADLRRWAGVKSVSKPEMPKGKPSGAANDQEQAGAEAIPAAPPVAVLRVEPSAA